MAAIPIGERVRLGVFGGGGAYRFNPASILLGLTFSKLANKASSTYSHFFSKSSIFLRTPRQGFSAQNR